MYICTRERSAYIKLLPPELTDQAVQATGQPIAYSRERSAHTKIDILYTRERSATYTRGKSRHERGWPDVPT